VVKMNLNLRVTGGCQHASNNNKQKVMVNKG